MHIVNTVWGPVDVADLGRTCMHEHIFVTTSDAQNREYALVEGVPPHRIVLGHSGDSTDIVHLSTLAGFGFVLGMDRFGINVGTTFEARADTLIEMCRRGFAGQMVFPTTRRASSTGWRPTFGPLPCPVALSAHR